MLKMIFYLYVWVFARVSFYKFNKLIYILSLRALGILNFETDKQSGEKYFIEHHVSQIRSGVVFDVGANVGNYSKLIRSCNSNVEIFCFEPHPVNFNKLQINTSKLNVHLFNVGVGDTVGKMELFDYADNDGSSHASLYKDVFEKLHKQKTVEHEVEIITLDEFSNQHEIDQVILLKIDTEGHELAVLKGFEKLIRAGRVDLIHFEFNEMNVYSRVFFKDFWDFLPDYDFYRMLPDGLVPIKKYSPVSCEIFAYQNIVAKLKLHVGISNHLSGL